MRAAFPILAIVREDSIRQASSVPNDAGRAEEVWGQMPFEARQDFPPQCVQLCHTFAFVLQPPWH